MMYIRIFLAAVAVLVGGVVRSSAQDPAPPTDPTVPSTEPATERGPLAGQPNLETPPASPAVKRFGGGFGSDFGHFPGFGPFGAASSFAPAGDGAGDPSQARYVASGAIIVTWSENYEKAWGFSKTTGRWTRQELDPGAKEPPVVDEGLGVIRAGSSIYAYSGQTGRWDVLRLPKDHNPKYAVHGDFVLVNDGSDIYTFADATGRWTSPKGESVDEGGGQTGATGGFMFGAGFDPLTSPAITSASQLRRTYDELDSAAAKLAQEYRAASATKGPEHPDLKRLKEQVAAAVMQAFQARQQLHQSELAEFQHRIQDVQRTIQARERIQNEIIQRRVNELLDPSVQWDRSMETGANEGGVAPGVTTSSPSAAPIGGGPTGIAGGAPSQGDPSSLSGFATAGSVPADRRPPPELGELPELGQWVDVGVVSEAADPERIVISSAELGGIRPGEELLVIRGSVNGSQLVGRIEIVQADDESAIGRVLVTRRVLVPNRYQPDQVSPGDRVARVRQVDVVEPLSPPVDTARETSVNNLKRLMLAMHSYHDTHQRFPPAVLLGKDGQGGPPHSWRVALLPFLNEHDLYNQYRFHEPWDSEHNRTLLVRMPAVYRSPRDELDSTHASYFALVTPGFTGDDPGALFGVHNPGGAAAPGSLDIPVPAPDPMGAAGLAPGDAAAGGFAVEPNWHRGTMFSRPAGIRILEIIDGTSNTVALVEAKRSIPWTRPHDIAYVADQSLPVLGGWFPEGWHAGFADGSARFISTDNDDATIRALFTIGGGEPLQPEVVK